MNIIIGKHDILVIDRGLHKQESQPRYLVVVDDADRDIIDSKGKHTEYGGRVIASYMDDEAEKAGAHRVVKTSTCVVGGDKTTYSDDMVLGFNAEEKCMFIEDTLAEFLIEEKVATELVRW